MSLAKLITGVGSAIFDDNRNNGDAIFGRVNDALLFDANYETDSGEQFTIPIFLQTRCLTLYILQKKKAL